VDARRRRAADEERLRHAEALHFVRDVRHLLERRRDEAGKTDDVGIVLASRGEDLLRGHHHAEIDHGEVVALENDADDVLADVVDVALDRRRDDRALRLARSAGSRFFRLDERNEMAHRLLHHARALHHLRQEHLARAEEVAYDVHAVHERTFDHLDRARVLLPRLLGVLDDVRRDAVHQRMREAGLDGLLPPRQVLSDLPPLRLERLGQRHQPLRRVGPPVEHDVLDALAQFGRNVVVHAELARVDDAHRHAGADRVIQEHRVDASRTGSLPRKLKLTFDTPPDTFACGRCCRIQRVALMKSTA
jgi:hypothetical protein